MTTRVLVVEDEALAAEAHAAYVARVPGFEVAGVARSAGEAARFLADDPGIDLVLLDMHLPDGHGLGLLQRMRAGGHLCDVIAVTAARDADVVRHAVAQGVVLYLLKPFGFASFRAKLEQYAAYRGELDGASNEVAQDEVDRMLGSLRPAPTTLPKGMSADTMREVLVAIRVGRWRAISIRGGRRRRRFPGDRASLPRAPRRHRHPRTASTLRLGRPTRAGVPATRLSMERHDLRNNPRAGGVVAGLPFEGLRSCTNRGSDERSAVAG